MRKLAPRTRAPIVFATIIAAVAVAACAARGAATSPLACERLSKLSDRQWNDAFRSGGYTAEQTARYMNKIKEKIAQGLQVTARGN